MSWLQLTFVVDIEQVEPLTAMLEMFLAQAVTSENAGDGEYCEVAFPGTPDWQKVSVTGLFAESIKADPIIEFVHTNLGNAKSGATAAVEIPTSIEKLVDQDWERVWLSSFKPLQVGTDLWVCPSWCEPSAPLERNIILDPGLAFGTGTHATTAMCLHWLADQNLAGKTVLDYGSGSGILAIAALFSGASSAAAVDIDPQAVIACRENATRNAVEHKLWTGQPNELDSSKYDLVIANILADVIIELRDTLLIHLSPDGTCLLTGILSTQANRVIEAFGVQYQFLTRTHGQWCMLIGSRAQQVV